MHPLHIHEILIFFSSACRSDGERVNFKLDEELGNLGKFILSSEVLVSGDLYLHLGLEHPEVEITKNKET
jgi:hypothetical protein